ncbi:adenosine deaminase [Pseudoalteromonas sp. MMG010]|uniref:adenosine deaminase family protein n=1 Tax=Pseudoalteromonas sp. MMG010 TaxID=2822685 RepID=UPI001B3A2A2E|nr:adenosine deaminase [Pseudoalteromonas sp. MMG010]MBQ4832919.1 adenosine deaminase [Pseudoalteromonas sp. MMG010]
MLSSLRIILAVTLSIGLFMFNNVSAADAVFSTESDQNTWFDEFKATASDEQLYTFLYNMPKGGELHNHSSGSNFPRWWYALATNPKLNGGYTYYTKTSLNLCQGYGQNAFGFSPPNLTFINISEHTYQQLSDCEKSNYSALSSLTKVQKEAWKKSLWLDKKYEGRDEFFQTHWQRLNELTNNPYIAAEMLVKNMKAFANEGLIYLESQFNVNAFYTPQGSLASQDTALDIVRNRLSKEDAKETGVTVKLIFQLLRFAPNAEQQLVDIYKFVDKNRDIYVGINMVGREDNAKGHPLRFLSTLRELRQKYPAISLTIHAGEVDEPNFHIRDTLLLGADRIGHGVNLLGDPQTVLLMRHNKYLIEVNLISNLLLEYVDDFSKHPFPEFLRTGIPVALSTDDRGMFNSNLTDEFFIAVKSFNLSWQEVMLLSENSLSYSFLAAEQKQQLLNQFNNNMAQFSQRFKKQGEKSLTKKAVINEFIKRHYPTLNTHSN